MEGRTGSAALAGRGGHATTPWRNNPTYMALPALRRTLARMSDAHFERLSAFLQQPHLGSNQRWRRAGGRAFGVAKPRISTYAAKRAS